MPGTMYANKIVITEENVRTIETFNGLYEASVRVIELKEHILELQNELKRALEQDECSTNATLVQKYKKEKKYNEHLTKELLKLRNDNQELMVHYDKLKRQRTNEILDKTVQLRENHRYLQAVLETVCVEFNVSEDDIKGRSRERIYCIPRQIFCYFACNREGMTLSMVGRFINNDHASVLYNKRKVTSDMEVDAKFRQQVEDIETRILI